MKAVLSVFAALLLACWPAVSAAQSIDTMSVTDFSAAMARAGMAPELQTSPDGTEFLSGKVNTEFGAYSVIVRPVCCSPTPDRFESFVTILESFVSRLPKS